MSKMLSPVQAGISVNDFETDHARYPNTGSIDWFRGESIEVPASRIHGHEIP